MKPLLEHRDDYLQDNVSNQTHLAYTGQPNTLAWVVLHKLRLRLMQSNQSHPNILLAWVVICKA